MGSRICRGFKPGSILNIQVNAENLFGAGPLSEIYQHEVGDLSTPTHLPASAGVSVKGNSFLITNSPVLDRDVTGFGYWANTSNSFAGAKLFKRVRKPARSAAIEVGTVNLTDGTTVLEYDTDYYWFVTSSSGDDIDSATATACDDNPQIVMATVWLQHLTTPWKMQRPKLVSISAGRNETAYYDIPANRIALIWGYYIDGGASGTASIEIVYGITYSLEISSGGVALNRIPSVTNGMYLPPECRVQIVTSDHAGANGRFRILEFDDDPNIVPVLDYVSKTLSIRRTHVVSSDSKFVVTYAIDRRGASCWFQIYEDSAWVTIWDIYGNTWKISDGVLQFPPSTEICCDDSGGSVMPTLIYLFGFEVRVEAAP
jgi:hypothetical protein